MNMILRRRAMMRAIASASGPLYPMEDRTATVSSSISITTSGNHVEWKTTSNSRGPYIGKSASLNSTSIEASWPIWFPLVAGDVVDLWAKNISYPTTSNTPRSAISLKDTSGTTIVGIPDFHKEANGTDLHMQKMIESAADIHAILFWNYRPITASADIEIYVNGVRYV